MDTVFKERDKVQLRLARHGLPSKVQGQLPGKTWACCSMRPAMILLCHIGCRVQSARMLAPMNSATRRPAVLPILHDREKTTDGRAGQWVALQRCRRSTRQANRSRVASRPSFH